MTRSELGGVITMPLFFGENMKFWPVTPPLDQYNEDVGALAKIHNLKIFDPNTQIIHHHHHGMNLPILTLKTVENPEILLNTESKTKRSKRNKNVSKIHDPD